MNSPKYCLLDMFRDLRSIDAKAALIGGLAVSIRAEERMTKDVDFAVAVRNVDQAKQLAGRLILELGYKPGELFCDAKTHEFRGARLWPPEHRAAFPVDLLFSTCGIEQEVVAAAESLSFLGAEMRVATCGHLIAMKVLSLDDTTRIRDRGDLAGLLKVASSADLKVAREGVALMEQRGYGHAHGKDLHHDLAQCVQLYAPGLWQQYCIEYPSDDRLPRDAFIALSALCSNVPRPVNTLQGAEHGREFNKTEQLPTDVPQQKQKRKHLPEL